LAERPPEDRSAACCVRFGSWTRSPQYPAASSLAATIRIDLSDMTTRCAVAKSSLTLRPYHSHNIVFAARRARGSQPAAILRRRGPGPRPHPVWRPIGRSRLPELRDSSSGQKKKTERNARSVLEDCRSFSELCRGFGADLGRLSATQSISRPPGGPCASVLQSSASPLDPRALFSLRLRRSTCRSSLRPLFRRATRCGG